MLKRIHVNQHNIRKNAKEGTDLPCITVKTYKSNEYGHEVFINGPSRVVSRPDTPLSCGAKVWIETRSDVEVTVRTETQQARETTEIVRNEHGFPILDSAILPHGYTPCGDA